ncbi:MAG: tRNA cytidylyltransferase [Gemmatimonadota bacterium]|nr:tRNA cytidylyltransferase [Gemmatimonadota bacterium]
MTAEPRLKPPDAIREICGKLERAGHEAWCVGGAVRDALLGIRTLDWDIATSAHPEEVQKLFKRTVPVGLKFGTVGVLDAAGVLHEVTTFRHDVETDGRHAVVRFGASLEEDLARRDFTINAIAVHAERLEVRDPFDGRGDLARRLVRCVGEPAERMREDRLRALRALRFAGRFGFSIEPATWAAIRESTPHLGRLSMERVKQELEKVMEQVAAPAATLERYRDAGILSTLVPAIAGAPRERFAALDHLAPPGSAGRPLRRMLRLAALFVEPAAAPARDLERTLKTLKFSNVEVRGTLELAASAAKVSLGSDGRTGGDRAGDRGDGGGAGRPLPLLPPPSDVALRRLVAEVGRLNVPALARLLWARAAAEGRADRLGGIALYRRAMRIAWRDPIALADLAVDGDDLRRAGVAPGRAIGETLQRLLDAVLEDPARNTRAALLAMVSGTNPSGTVPTD